jgi:Na+/proline symporter
MFVLFLILFGLCWVFAWRRDEGKAIIFGFAMMLVGFLTTYPPETNVIVEVVKTFAIIVAILICARVYYVRSKNNKEVKA